MKKYKDYLNLVLNEINFVLAQVKEKEVTDLVKVIIKSNRIVICGAGRVGMAARGFAMRLAHLGFKAYALGDSNVPSIGKKDLLLAASGSGETQTIYDIVQIAKAACAKIALITGNPESRMGKLTDVTIQLRAPSKTKKVEGFSSIQPMTTLNEQCLGIFFDIVVLLLMKEMKETHDTMWARHSNLE